LGVTPSGQQIAIKVLRSELADDQRLRARLAREARAIAAVDGNRTAKVLEVVTDGPYAYLVMEYVPGYSLDELVSQGQKPEGPLLWFTALGLVEALQEIHAAGITHRDLKPSNVIIGPEGVKVVDFGISAITDEVGLTQTGTLMGSAAWLSPEQVTGAPTDQRTDVFNLGLTLAYLATGKHPFGEGRPDAVMYRITAQPPNLEAVPGSLKTAVEMCLQRNPSERPSLAALHHFFSSGGSGSAEVDLVSETGADSTIIVQPSDISVAITESNQGANSRELIQQPKLNEGALDGKRNRILMLASVVFMAAAAGLFIWNLSGSRDTGATPPASEVIATTAQTAPPTVQSSQAPPPTTTIPPNCYINIDGRGQRQTVCGPSRIEPVSRVKELNYLSTIRVLYGTGVYNNFGSGFDSPDEYWLQIGYITCMGLKDLGSYYSVKNALDQQGTGLDADGLIKAAVGYLCEQQAELIP
jgi:serine/threonine protein kinase